MKALILAGGGGTRLWPLARRNYPKQFLRLTNESSLLQQTAERLLNIFSPEDIIILTNQDYKFFVKAELDALTNKLSINPITHIILEPLSKNTAPALVLGIKYCQDVLGCKEDEIIFLSPSDQIIKPAHQFTASFSQVKILADQGNIVTFGIKPNKPETGYGYIKVQDSTTGKVEKFVEKPNLVTAQKYLSEGNYFWNSGMFAFSIKIMQKEMISHAPEMAKMMEMSYEKIIANFNQFANISIDYAIMEKSSKIALLPLDLSWSDVGSWDALYDLLDKDEHGNVKQGDVLTFETKNSLIISKKRLISTLGIDNCIIVETDDAILIAKKGESQKVREIVSSLKEKKRREADEPITVFRPWGNYTVLEEGTTYKIKRIVVLPKGKLSLQMHRHRSEHWIVVGGTAKVTIGTEEKLVKKNESIYVPKETLHRLENTGEEPVEIIEVQNGDYLGEDDIVRYEDIYGRNEKI